MRIKRAVASWFMVVVMMINLSPMEANAMDYEGHWAEATIGKWIENGYMKGYPDGTFRPDDTISKAEFIALMNRIYGYTAKADENYGDVSMDQWFYEDLLIAKGNVYMEWFSLEDIEANQPIERQEVSAILSCACRLKATQDLSANFIDAGIVADWSLPYVEAVTEKGYMKGYEDSTLRPEGNITRAEALVMLDRILGEIVSEAGTFGSEESETVIDGNMTVTAPDVTVENTVIRGDLMLAAGIGEGDVELKDVRVEGQTVVSGGGENSITINNSSLGDVIVIKVDDKIRIVSRKSSMDRIVMSSGGKLEGEFEDAVVEVLSQGESIVLDGDFEEIKVEAEAFIDISEDTEVQEIVFSKPAVVTGEGTVVKAVIETDGVKMAQGVEEKTVEAGIDGSGVKVISSTTGSGGGGGGSTRPVADTSGPMPGNHSTLTISDVTLTDLTVHWTKATDNTSVGSTLQYRVYYSDSDNIDDVAAIEANGTPAGDFETDTESKTILGLSEDTTYYVNVVVMDEAGNKAAYTRATQKTLLSEDTSEPVAGGLGVMSITDETSTSLTLNWTQGSDDRTADEDLMYQVYYSINDNIDSVSYIESNGTALGSYQADIGSKAVTELIPATTYYFNVIVKDEAGNKGAYTSVSGITGEATGNSMDDPLMIDSIEDMAQIGTGTHGWTLDKYYALTRDLDFQDPDSYEDMNSKDLTDMDDDADTDETLLDALTDISGKGWRPIGYHFTGHFDGRGHVIKNIHSDRSVASGHVVVGLFEVVTGSVENLGMIGGSVSATSNSGTDNSSYSFAGPIAGQDGGLIKNCYADVYATATGCGPVATGGITGYISIGGEVTNAYAVGNNHSQSTEYFAYAGGITGTNDKGSINNSIAFNGRISASGARGTLVDRIAGSKAGDSTVSHNYARNDMVISGNRGIGYDGTDMTEEQFKSMSTYHDGSGLPGLSEWDFTTLWEIKPGSDRPTFIETDDGGTIIVDTTAPSAGNSGVVTRGDVTTTTVNLGWTKATDDISAQTDLMYLVYYSTSDNIQSVSDMESNGTAVGSYASDIDTKEVTGLTNDTSYFFNLVVKDLKGNKTAYVPLEQRTEAAVDTSAPTPGSGGSLGTSDESASTIEVNWVKGIDNTSAQADLSYLVYYSTSDNIDTVAEMESNGTAAGSYNTDITSKVVAGLSSATTYYFNVIVKDEVGNKGAYAATTSTTLVDPGDGSSANPYKIFTLEDLEAVGRTDLRSGWGLDKYYILMTSLDVSSISNWQPIGNDGDSAFTGYFDGNDKTLSNLSLEELGNDHSNKGMFGYIKNATVKDIRLADATVETRSIGDNVGSLIGYAEGSVITNAHGDNVTVKGGHRVGGLIGKAVSCSISLSSSSGDVSIGLDENGNVSTEAASSNRSFGGFIGLSDSSNVTNSFSTCDVTGNLTCLGGFVGSIYDRSDNTYFAGCYSSGTVKTVYVRESVNSHIGGFAGEISSSYSQKYIQNCYTTSDIVIEEPAVTKSVGGFVGANETYRGQFYVMNTYATGSVEGEKYIGGFIGSNYDSSGSSIATTYNNIAFGYQIRGEGGDVNRTVGRTDNGDFYTYGNQKALVNDVHVANGSSTNDPKGYQMTSDNLKDQAFFENGSNWAQGEVDVAGDGIDNVPLAWNFEDDTAGKAYWKIKNDRPVLYIGNGDGDETNDVQIGDDDGALVVLPEVKKPIEDVVATTTTAIEVINLNKVFSDDDMGSMVYTISSGTLPDGITLSGYEISGTATTTTGALGVDIEVTATDKDSQQVATTLNMTINESIARYEEDFDNGEQDWFTSTFYSNGLDQGVGGTHGYKVSGTYSSGSSYSNAPLDLGMYSYITVHEDIRLASQGSRYYASMMSGLNKGTSSLYADGSVYYKDVDNDGQSNLYLKLTNGDIKTDTILADDTWYSIRTEYDLLNDTVQVYVDDVLVKDGADSNVDSFDISFDKSIDYYMSFGAGQRMTTYYDNVLITVK